MNTVKIDKDKLLARLRQNRESHYENFAKAQEGFREELIALLEKKLAYARAGKSIDLAIRLDQPVNMTKEYDNAIEMIEWTNDDVIELDRTQFCNFVLDQWDWFERVYATNSKYMK